jgi:transcriptional regulator with AAA-type ATPase domain
MELKEQVKSICLMAESHLKSVEDAIKELEQQKNKIEQELNKLNEYFKNGIKNLTDVNNSFLSDSVSVNVKKYLGE